MINKKTEIKQQEIVDFLLSLSFRFIALMPEEFEVAMAESLAKIAELVKTDRCYIYQFEDNNSSITLIHSFEKKGLKAKILRHDHIDSEDFSWLINSILSGTSVNISSIEKLPAKSSTIKAIMQVENTQSSIMSPMIFNDECLGFIGLDAVQEKKSFSKETEYLLEKCAAIFAGAIRQSNQLKSREHIEQKFRTLFSEIDDVVFISSPEGHFFEINPAGAKMFGYSSTQELLKVDIGRDIYFNQKDRKKFQTAIEEKGQIKDYELILKNKKGKKLFVMVTASTIHDENNNVIAYQGILHNVTYRRLLEEQLFQAKKMESIGLLAGGIAHDFNNILTIINGFAEIIMMEMDPSDKHHEDLENLMKGVKRAEDLIHQLLAFSRKQMIAPKVININKIVTEFFSMLNRLISEDIQLEMELKDNISYIKADPIQIQQILVNLVVNADRAIKNQKKKDKPKKIQIITDEEILDNEFTDRYPGSRPGKFIVISVRDTGIGMDEDIKQHIFEPFFSTNKAEKGTGLGLSTVYGIVKQNEGNIYVESEPGEGSLFQIYWPATEERTLTESKIESDIKFQPRSENILFVEDDIHLRTLMSNALRQFGYQVVEAENGLKALEIVKHNSLAHKIDLVISDIIMPEMGGEELAENLRQLNPKVKILLTSGFTDSRISSQDLDNRNRYYFIAKPYAIKKLEKTIRSILSNTV